MSRVHLCEMSTRPTYELEVDWWLPRPEDGGVWRNLGGMRMCEGLVYFLVMKMVYT